MRWRTVFFLGCSLADGFIYLSILCVYYIYLLEFLLYYLLSEARNVYCLLTCEPVVGVEHTVHSTLSAPGYSSHCREWRSHE